MAKRNQRQLSLLTAAEQRARQPDRSESLKQGKQLKQAGQDEAADNRKSLLEFARQQAKAIARNRPDRTVTADDVAEALEAAGVSVFALGNAAGSIFRGKDWEFTGRRIRSARPHAHANELKVWRFNGEA